MLLKCIIPTGNFYYIILRQNPDRIHEFWKTRIRDVDTFEINLNILKSHSLIKNQ